MTITITTKTVTQFGFVPAYQPWRSPYREDGRCTVDADEVERCMCCPLAAECCDRCDGHRNVAEVRRRGRPRKNEMN